MKQQTQNDLQVCSALREGYRQADWKSDICSGIVVGIVALPLSMALAIASGVPPQHGLFTAIVAGVMLVLMGVARLGKLIQFVPHPVTTGFTSGIAVVITTRQVKDLYVRLLLPEEPAAPQSV